MKLEQLALGNLSQMLGCEGYKISSEVVIYVVIMMSVNLNGI